MCCSVAAGRTGPAQCAAHHVACTVAGASSPVCTYIRICTPLDETLCSHSCVCFVCVHTLK